MHLPDFCVNAIQISFQDGQEFAISCDLLACIIHLLDCLFVQAFQLLFDACKFLQPVQGAVERLQKDLAVTPQAFTTKQQDIILQGGGHLHTPLHVHDLRESLIVHKVIDGVDCLVCSFYNLRCVFTRSAFCRRHVI